MGGGTALVSRYVPGRQVIQLFRRDGGTALASSYVPGRLARADYLRTRNVTLFGRKLQIPPPTCMFFHFVEVVAYPATAMCTDVAALRPLSNRTRAHPSHPQLTQIQRGHLRGNQPWSPRCADHSPRREATCSVSGDSYLNHSPVVRKVTNC